MKLINWNKEITKEDVKRYEKTLDKVFDTDDLDKRMDICDQILTELGFDYPHFYDELEDEIKDLVTR